MMEAPDAILCRFKNRTANDVERVTQQDIQVVLLNSPGILFREQIDGSFLSWTQLDAGQRLQKLDEVFSVNSPGRFEQPLFQGRLRGQRDAAGQVL